MEGIVAGNIPPNAKADEIIIDPVFAIARDPVTILHDNVCYG